MTFEEIKALDHQYVMQSYGRFDVAVDHGRGATLWDTQGREYIDFTSGIGVCSLGYADEGWVNAITEQAGKLGHISNLFYAEPYVKAAEKLCRKAGMSNVFFANSGAESNEGLIKLARKYSFDKYGKGRGTIITLHKSFHGRTITTLSATGQDMFELIQGEGGVLPLDREFVQKVSDLCAKRDWLLLIDEVQTGVGRTGSLFAFQQYGIQPDAVSFAKGIAGGLPFGGVMAGEKCRNVFTTGTHGTTFGGNPISAAAACYVLDRMDDAMFQSVQEKGAYLRSRIEALDLPCLGATRGMGLMIGIDVKGERTNKELAAKLIQSGLLVLTAGPGLRLLPPRVITQEEMDKGLAIMKAALS